LDFFSHDKSIEEHRRTPRSGFLSWVGERTSSM
jgi:hypothetical protein